jgi:proteasome accessory factor C
VTATAADRTARLLTLLPWLQARPGVEVLEAAAHFGVSESTLLSDLALLTYVGPGQAGGDLVDIDYEPGGTITVISSQGLDVPLRLTPTEAAALISGLRLLAELPAPGTDAVLTALAKLTEAVGEAAGITVQVDPIAPAVAEAISVALARRARLWLRYRGALDETTEREVDPMRLLVLEGRTYLEAWCRRAEGVRLFRLDRVELATVLDAPAEPPPTAERLDPAAGPLSSGEPVTLDLAPSAAWVPEAHAATVVAERPDGSIRVSMRIADRRWLVRLVLSLGGAARVVDPADAAAAVREAADEALARYRSTPPAR